MKLILSAFLSLLLGATAVNAQQEPIDPCMNMNNIAKTGELIKNGQFDIAVHASALMGVITITGNRVPSEPGQPALRFFGRYDVECKNGTLRLTRVSMMPSAPVINTLSGTVTGKFVEVSGKGADGADYKIKLSAVL